MSSTGSPNVPMRSHTMDRLMTHPALNRGVPVEFFLALAACALTLLGVRFGFAFVFVAILAVVVFLAVRKAGPVAQVAVLMVAIQLNIFSIEFGDRLYTFENFYTLRPAVPVAAIMVSLLLWRVLNGTEKLGYLPALGPLLLLDGAFFSATLLHFASPYFLRGLMSCTLLALNIGIFVLFLRHLLPDRELIDRASRWLIAMYAIYALAGVLMVLLNVSGLDPHNHLVQLDILANYTMTAEGGNTPIPRPWSFDPNTGSQMAAVCLLALTKAMQRDERHRQLLWLCAALIFLGVMLSFARGAWVGLGFGLALLPFGIRYVPFGGQKLRQPVWRTLLILGATTVGGYFLIISFLPYLKEVLIDRLLTLSDWDKGTMFMRYQNWMLLITDGLHSPIIGHGGTAYRSLLPAPLVPESFLVETFHSAGLLGVSAFVWLQVHLLRRALRVLRAGRHLEIRWIMPFVIAYSGYFLAVQTNPNIWSAFYWMFLALLTAALYQGHRDRPGLTVSEIK
jgi:hypothetical protein